jgi:hypothetical protein
MRRSAFACALAIKRVSSLAYGRYALAGEEESAKVARLELCEAMTTAAGGK